MGLDPRTLRSPKHPIGAFSDKTIWTKVYSQVWRPSQCPATIPRARLSQVEWSLDSRVHLDKASPLCLQHAYYLLASSLRLLVLPIPGLPDEKKISDSSVCCED